MKNFLELCTKRFSARKYTAETVDPADLDYVLEAARLAPSACNRQPWRFVIASSDEAKAKLRQCYNREWFASAPLYIIGLKSEAKGWVRADDNKSHADIDLAIAIEHICLAATERGLGTCWVCNYDVESMKQLFDFGDYAPVAIIPIGHIAPDCPCAEKKRSAMDDIIETI